MIVRMFEVQLQIHIRQYEQTTLSHKNAKNVQILQETRVYRSGLISSVGIQINQVKMQMTMSVYGTECNRKCSLSLSNMATPSSFWSHE